MSSKHNSKIVPADWWQGLKENFSTEILSGFMVFLIALPLSLGIAKASDFPPVMGLVTAIVGGLVVSFLAGSRLTIKGPAAGLIVIASGAVAEFGGGETGWHFALAAIVVAGILQVLFGLMKLGKISDFFPSSAVHGMLAAIGIIIMSKQIHFLLGVDPAILKGKEPLALLAMIPSSLVHENAHLTEIGIACLLIMIAFSYVKNEKIKKIPAPLVVLAIAVPLGLALHIKTEGAIHNFAMVKVGSLFDKLGFNVDFGIISANPGGFIKYVIMFALIGSIESMLTVKAIDDLDPYHRKSDDNKDLVGVGIGNVIAGCLGGLAMISEVARSSANVGNGAKTRWANFFHGLILLIFLICAVPLIEMIPNTALAAMLIFVGYRLAHPREFINAWKVGKEQFSVFMLTVIMTLATDLLVGVGSGIVLEMILNISLGAKIKSLFKSNVEIIETGEELELIVYSSVVFSNIMDFKLKLGQLPKGRNLKVNLSFINYIDHTTMHLLYHFEHDYKLAGGTIHLVGLDCSIPFSSHPQSGRRVL